MTEKSFAMVEVHKERFKLLQTCAAGDQAYKREAKAYSAVMGLLGDRLGSALQLVDPGVTGSSAGNSTPTSACGMNLPSSSNQQVTLGSNGSNEEAPLALTLVSHQSHPQPVDAPLPDSSSQPVIVTIAAGLWPVPQASSSASSALPAAAARARSAAASRTTEGAAVGVSKNPNPFVYGSAQPRSSLSRSLSLT